MKQTQITKCPKCDTTFRVSPAQLEVAKGAVRCGACLHVFRASDHFQAAKKPEPVIQDDRTQDLFESQPAQAQPEPSAVEPESNQFDQHSPNETRMSDTEDDAAIIEDIDHQSDAQDAIEAPQPSNDEFDLSQPLENDEDDFLIDDNNGLIDDDFGIDEDRIHDDAGKASPIISDLDEEFLSINADADSDPFYTESDKLIDTVKTDDSEDDESWADALLDDSQEASTSEQTQQKNLKPAPDKPVFSYIETDPLDLSLPQKKSRRQFWIWSSCALVLLVTLVGQLGFFNFDKWARDEAWRPYYALICEQVGCTLPSSYDIKQIRTTASPQVTSHPKFKNALSVDVLFMNHAPYEQSFHKLELTFTDTNNNVVAHRLFTPREYLAGEASGLTLMPVETPIHIALEIQDPGPQANNYQVRFIEP